MANLLSTTVTGTITSSGNVTAPTFVGSLSGNASTATSADQIDGVAFRNTGSNAGMNADTIASNGITYYTSGVSNFSGNATDGALYSQAYSSSWQHQIAGDYRSGQIALRGKNNGTWQAWRTVLDSSNFSTWADGAGAADAVNVRIDNEVLPAIGAVTLATLGYTGATNANYITNNNQLTNGAGYLVQGGTQNPGGWTSSTRFKSSGPIADSDSGSHSLQVIADNGNDAFMAFHISSDYAVFFGLDGGTNRLHTGGWSAGANQYMLWDSRDFSSTNISNWNTAHGWGNHAGLYDAAGTGAAEAGGVKTWVQEQNYASDAAISTAIGTVTLASLGYTGATNANYITNNNQLTNGAGYITSADGGNAQTLDGIDSSSFLRSDADDTHSGTLALTAITAASGSIANTKGSYLHIGAWGTGRTAADAVLVNTAYRSDILSYTRSFTIGNTARNFNGSANVSWSLADIGAEAAGSAAAVDGRIDNEVLPAIPTNNNQLTNGAGYLTTTGKAADSNLLDGINSSSFLRSDANDTATGNLTFTGNARFDAALTVLNTVPAIYLTESDANSDYAIRNNFGVFNIYDNTNLQNRLSIRSDGNVGIGKTNPSAKLDVEGAITASGDITAFSDARVKENVETIPNALEKVTALRGVNFNKIGEEKRSTGVIAQEVKEVLPEVIHENEDGMLSVAYGNITGVLIEAIKEQQKQIDELKAQLDGLTK